MDLLGDLGNADQLTSARAENAVLSEKVKELSFKVKALTLENQSLLAEVEMYRKEAALPNFSNLALGKADSSAMMDTDEADTDEFVCSGNGVYPSEAAVTLKNLHGMANPLCCALNAEDTILATGGADSSLNLCQWGAALAPSPDAAEKVVQFASRIPCPAPVICTAFSRETLMVAGGCMDGSIRVVRYGPSSTGLETHVLESNLKHAKYIKSVAWCPTAPMLATASADGTVVLSKVNNQAMETVQTLHLPGAVETLCFSEDGRLLLCYARDTPYLSVFDLDDQCQQIKMNLNNGGVNGGFEEHVSFAVMDMAVSPGGKYLALATDTSRNIIIDAASGKQIRNLYGHKNDAFSVPQIGWSSNGQYIMGNTQDDSSVCVWDIASTKIVNRLEGHTQPVRSLYSSPTSDTMVTTSFDRTTKIWLTPM